MVSNKRDIFRRNYFIMEDKKNLNIGALEHIQYVSILMSGYVNSIRCVMFTNNEWYVKKRYWDRFFLGTNSNIKTENVV